MTRSKLTLMVALALAANVSFADEDDPVDPGGPLIGTPVAPVLPTVGTWARASASRNLFVGCADYSLSGVYVDEGQLGDVAGGGAITVGCNDSVYDRASKQETSTTPGQRISVSPSSSLGSGSAWKSSRAGAAAESNLLGPGNVLNLKAGARARNSRDVEMTLGVVVDPWTLDPVGWEPGLGSGFNYDVARLIGEGDNYGAGATARLADQFVANGTGRLVMEFRADGLYERGGGLPQIMPSGGRVSFAAVLLDPTGLRAFDMGGDFGTVRMWQEGAIDVASFALGRDRNDDLFGGSQFPDAELLLGSDDLFAPQSSHVPSGDLPTTPTPVDKLLRVELDVVDGKTYWLIAGLHVSASGWNPCDTMPGDGEGPSIAGVDPSVCQGDGTLVDFTSTVELSSVLYEGGLQGLQTASGVDYRLAVTPVPLPPALWLMGAGLTVLAGRAREARRKRQA